MDHPKGCKCFICIGRPAEEEAEVVPEEADRMAAGLDVVIDQEQEEQEEEA